MPTITAIEPQKRKKEKFNIFLDGKFAFSLPSEVVLKRGLVSGREISPSEIEELIKENELTTVFEKVLKFLSFRPRSEFEINEYLLRKKIGQETRRLVWEKLKKLALVDDEAFARWWIEQRSSFRPSGAKLIRYELKQKGIAEEIINSLLNDGRLENSEALLAEKLIQKKLERWKNLPPNKIKEKIYNTLAQRGFELEIIQKTVAKIFKKR